MSKPLCKYGASCYRKNADHLKRFSHPSGELEKAECAPDTKRRKLSKDVDPLPDHLPPTTSEKEGAMSLGNGKEKVPSASLEDSRGGDAVEKLFLVKLPEDFYLFWDFCKALQPSSPSSALKSSLGLNLVGPYDTLAGRLDSKISWEQGVLHCRHYYDPPEMTTVLMSGGIGEIPGFHIGYFRDDPSSEQFLLVSNDSEHCELEIEGGDIFSAVSHQVQARLQRGGMEKEMMSLRTLDSKLSEWRAKLNASPCKSMVDLQRKRKKEIVATTFNKFGISVPYDKKTELGYRPLPMTDRELLKLLNKICNSNAAKQDAVSEPLQEIVTFIQFANDECDYGMGLELGMDLFCHGDIHFHKVLEHVLPLAYELLGRDSYARICRLHLKHRNRIPLNYTTS